MSTVYADVCLEADSVFASVFCLNSCEGAVYLGDCSDGFLILFLSLYVFVLGHTYTRSELRQIATFPRPKTETLTF